MEEKQLGHFASRLKQLREAAGYSQNALAEKAGLTRQALSRLELGEREPTWETVQRLATALGADCSEFNDPELEMPEEKPPSPLGRPRKTPAPQPAPKPTSRKKGSEK